MEFMVLCRNWEFISNFNHLSRKITFQKYFSRQNFHGLWSHNTSYRECMFMIRFCSEKCKDVSYLNYDSLYIRLYSKWERSPEPVSELSLWPHCTCFSEHGCLLLGEQLNDDNSLLWHCKCVRALLHEYDLHQPWANATVFQFFKLWI